MQDSRRPAAIQAALQFVMTSDTPSELKATLIEVLTQALRDNDDAAAAQLSRHAIAQAGVEWQEHEIAQLQSYLRDRVARSWQHADEYVMHLAAQLHRDPRSVRDKATQLGLGASVDYRFAKALKQAHGD